MSGEDAILMDRRVFIGSGASFCAVSLLPMPVFGVPVGPAPTLLSDWTIDDMWGVYPRYADPIAYGCAPAGELPAAHPADVQFVP